MVGFTSLSARLTPQEMLQILSDLFAEFDDATETLGVQKLKTIGDAYLVCCGAFDETETEQSGDGQLIGPDEDPGERPVAESSSSGSSPVQTRRKSMRGITSTVTVRRTAHHTYTSTTPTPTPHLRRTAPHHTTPQ